MKRRLRKSKQMSICLNLMLCNNRTCSAQGASEALISIYTDTIASGMALKHAFPTLEKISSTILFQF